jgi:hypothetical protein
MKHPLLEIPRPRRLYLFLLFLGLTLVTMMALNISGRALSTAAAPAGIVSYEFAGDVTTAHEIIASWNQTARIYAGFSLGLDYFYLFLYATTIGMALLWLTDGIHIRWLTAAAVVLAWAMGLAAFLDAIENYALLVMLASEPAEPWPQVAWWSAAIKFSLIIAALLLVFGAALLKARSRWHR